MGKGTALIYGKRNGANIWEKEWSLYMGKGTELIYGKRNGANIWENERS